MKRLGIIQPGKIGDIIICLPIAKYYAEQGYEVIWPIWDKIIDNFIGRFDFVQFVPCAFNCHAARQYLKISFQVHDLLELAFSIPGASNTLTEFYKSPQNTQYTFDQYKYALANVPFENKWNPDITPKIHESNVELLKISIGNSPYSLVQYMSSDQQVSIPNMDNIVVIRSIPGISIFDWLGLVDGATEIHLIESAFSNMIDQYSKRNDNLNLYLKHGYYGDKLINGNLRGIPILKKNWNII